MPYIVGRKPKMPVGVRRSPSRLAGEVPLPPSHAVHGPDAWRQQPPRLAQSRNAPWVELRVRATTVISCVAVPVSRRLAKVAAQLAARSSLAEAEATIASAATKPRASFIARQTTEDGRVPARRPGASGATAVLAFRDACFGGRPTALVAPRLPGRAVAAAAPARDVLGLRPPRAHRRADRERARGLAAHSRLRAALLGTFPAAPPAPDRRLRR